MHQHIQDIEPYIQGQTPYIWVAVSGRLFVALVVLFLVPYVAINMTYWFV